MKEGLINRSRPGTHTGAFPGRGVEGGAENNYLYSFSHFENLEFYRSMILVGVCWLKRDFRSIKEVLIIQHLHHLLEIAKALSF